MSFCGPEGFGPVVDYGSGDTLSFCFQEIVIATPWPLIMITATGLLAVRSAHNRKLMEPLRYHNARYILTYVSGLLFLAELAAFQVLFAEEGNEQRVSNPISLSLRIISLGASLAYYRMAEVSGRTKFQIPLFIFWAGMLGAQIVIVVTRIESFSDDLKTIFAFQLLNALALLSLLYVECKVRYLKGERRTAIDALGLQHHVSESIQHASTRSGKEMQAVSKNTDRNWSGSSSSEEEDGEKKRNMNAKGSYEDELLYVHRYQSLFQRVTFNWIWPILQLGNKKFLEFDDLGTLPHSDKSEHVNARFHQIWEAELHRKDGKPANLLRACFKFSQSHLVPSAVCKFGADLLGFVGPLAVMQIIEYAEQVQNPQLSPDPTPSADIAFSTFLENGYVMAGILFLSVCLRGLLLQYSFHLSIRIGMRIRSALQTETFKKSLKLPLYIKGREVSTGQIVNHISTDMLKIIMFYMLVNTLWAAPIQVLLTIGFLVSQIGVSALLGFAVIVVLVPIVGRIARAIGILQRRILVHTDKRLKFTNELLQGMKIVKMMGWQEPMAENIGEARKKELWAMVKAYTANGMNTAAMISVPTLVTLVAFGMYEVITGDPLTPSQAFTSLSLFQLLQLPLIIFPMSLRNFFEARVSIRRIEKFLLVDDLPELLNAVDDDTILNVPNDGSPAPEKSARKLAPQSSIGEDFRGVVGPNQDGSSFEIQNGVFYWEDPNKPPETSSDSNSNGRQSPAKSTGDGSSAMAIAADETDSSTRREILPVLEDITISIPRGKLTGVVGPVGCGKSSMLQAMLGEIHAFDGQKRRRMFGSLKVSYVPQKAWIVNQSVKANILMGRPMDRTRYEEAIDRACLAPDLKILPAGDETEIGERGINLSGGQKQRVALARAFFSNADVLLLDDPLSALDAHVGKRLFEEGILKLRNEGRTVVLVTHQLWCTPQCDHLIALEQKRVKAQGAYPDVRHHVDFDAIAASRKAQEEMEDFEQQDTLEVVEEDWENGSNVDDDDRLEEINPEQLTAVDAVSIASHGSTSQLAADRPTSTRSIHSMREAMNSTRSGASMRQRSVRSGADSLNPTEKEELDKSGKLMTVENRETGSVAWSTYKAYAKAMGYVLFTVFMIIFVLSRALQIGRDFLLAEWSTDVSSDDPDHSTEYWLSRYSLISFAAVLMIFLTFVVTAIAGRIAARALHRQLLTSIANAPMRFFDTTPIGRILNRFSSDTNLIDQRLIDTILVLTNQLLVLASSVVVNTIVQPFFMIAFVPLSVIYYYIQRFFRRTLRELQRIEAVTRSPIYASVSEMLEGLPVIRASTEEKLLLKEWYEKVDANALAFLFMNTANRWLGVRLDLLGGAIIASSAFSLVAVADSVEPAEIGLALSYSLQITNVLSMLVRQIADLEMQMNAVERVVEYVDVEQEPRDGKDPGKGWPNKGAIEFKEVSCRYRPGLEPAVQNLTVSIKPGEKVGICGRTGSGKSTITLAMYRMLDIVEGGIVVDGENISDVNLTKLRQSVAIIPQDPVLFLGSVRYNLDPFDRYTDDDIWHALHLSQMDSAIRDMGNGLESEVAEDGDNFSHGQRQLLCLARAILLKCHILIMDEATASVDMETDHIIQEVVREQFTDCTILTIAHRIDTIMDYDKILVMDSGRLVEFDSPDVLLQRRGSIFRSLTESATHGSSSSLPKVNVLRATGDQNIMNDVESATKLSEKKND
eukprot:Clim_evm3s20 gene=Clim_evmTU3s20